MFRIIKLLIFIFLFTGIGSLQAEAGDPFKINLKYIPPGLLMVELERLSRDEVAHPMQQLVIYKNDESAQVEDMINQNHLNKMIKYISLPAEPGDVILAKLHYAEDDVLITKITVEKSPATYDDRFMDKDKGPSILIKDKVSQNQQINSSEPANDDSAGELLIEDRPPMYGYKDLGYKPENERYGYSLEENEDMKRGADLDPVYGYTVEKKEEEGYELPGRQEIGQKGFGKSGYGYEGEENQFGREEYEQ